MKLHSLLINVHYGKLPVPIENYTYSGTVIDVFRNRECYLVHFNGGVPKVIEKFTHKYPNYVFKKGTCMVSLLTQYYTKEILYT